MGSSSSSPTVETHQDAFSKTADTRQVMDQLLNYMIKQLSIRDLLQMSNPAECKKYVLFKANSIYQYFYELRIFPGKDAKGVLTFRKADDLTTPKGEKKEEQEKERQSLCLIVAYFYTRIFQIYGALALTLIDDMNAMTSSGIMSLPSISNNRLRAPGYYPQQPYQGKGGVNSDKLVAPEISRYTPIVTSSDTKQSLKNFKWIRDYLILNEYRPGAGFRTNYQPPSSSERGVVYIDIEDSIKDKNFKIIPSNQPPPLETWQEAIFYIGISGMTNYAKLEVETRDKAGELKIEMNNLTFKNTFKENISTDQFKKDIYLEEQNLDGRTAYYVKGTKGTNINTYLNNYFSKVIQYLKDAIKEHKNADDSDSTRSMGPRSEESITKHLQVEKMIGDLSKRKPLGHCIARALQLLNTEAFKGQPGISQICNATFAENKRMGVVKPGAQLSESPGLFALANLFYDTITMGSPKLTIGTRAVDGKQSSMEQYVGFMKTLSEQYGSEPPTSQENGLEDITDTRDKKKCSTSTDIQLSPDTTASVRTIVKTMFQQQVLHAAKCNTIISMLFDITKDKATQKPIYIKLHHNLITKGFPELERINYEARKILIDYYTNCESKYITGMDIILKEQKAQKDAAHAKVEAERMAKASAEAKAVTNTAAKAATVTKAVAATIPKPKVATVTKEVAATIPTPTAKVAVTKANTTKAVAAAPPPPPPTMPLMRRISNGPPAVALRRTTSTEERPY